MFKRSYNNRPATAKDEGRYCLKTGTAEGVLYRQYPPTYLVPSGQPSYHALESSQDSERIEQSRAIGAGDGEANRCSVDPRGVMYRFKHTRNIQGSRAEHQVQEACRVLVISTPQTNNNAYIWLISA